MKKFYSLLVFLFCASVGLYADETYHQPLPTTDTYSVSQLTQVAGKDYAYFIVGVNGTRVYTAYQLDVFLPTGMEPYYENGKAKVEMVKGTGTIYPYTEDEDGIKSFTHSLVSNVISTGAIRVITTSNSNQSFTANVGPLFRVYVKVSPYMKAGTSDVRITGAILIEELYNEMKAQQWNVTDASYGVDAGSSRSVTLNVTSENKFGTCILPFDAALPEGLSAYSCSEVNGSSIILTPQTSFKAYTPYIVYAEKGCSATLTGTADESKYVESATSGLLMGAVTTQQLTSGYVLQNKGNGPCFYKVGSSAFSLAPGKCCLKLSSSEAGAKEIYDFGTITGLSAPSTVSTDILNATKYSLDGIRITSPQKGQIYLQSGKKIINQ